MISMLAPRKSLGQNFLRDENIARKIIDSLGPGRNEIVLEIGPGQGDLTKFLLPAASTVIGVDVDTRALGVLRERFGTTLELLEQDILTVRLEDIAERFNRKLCVVGNIPYYITTAIIFWLFDQRAAVDRAILMMQYEVADRLVAQPGTKEYGILSIFTKFYSDAQLLFKVSRNSFHPRPHVDSAIVKFEFKKIPPDVDQQLFRNVVRGTFATRRKTLRNGLRMMGFDESSLATIGFELGRRPEELTLEEFVHLTDLLKPHASQLSLKF
jgi:16S rRNA (adenine1518-N6/adenine1519-N6)-dimethyltransferase